MTIAAGFACTDGMLLASDTLYSGAQSKNFGRKLWPIECGTTTVCFGAAGLEVSIHRMKDEIEQTIRPEMSHSETVKQIDKILGYVTSRQRRKAEQLFVLMAIRTPDRLALYQNADNNFLAPVRRQGQCVGWAEGLAQYLADRLFNDVMNIRWAQVVAAYLIKQAKTYSDFCDGDTHLLSLPIEGSPELITDQDEIKRMESHLDQLDDAMRVVLPGGRFEASDFTLQHRLQELVKAIDKVRNVQAAIGLTTVQSTFQGYPPTVRQEPAPKKAE